MRHLNLRPGAPSLAALLLFAGTAALRAGDQPSETHGPADLASLEEASPAEAPIDGAALRVTAGLRVPVRDEIEGLDLSEHGEEAYFGGEVGSFAGPGVTLGQSVIVSHPVEGRR